MTQEVRWIGPYISKGQEPRNVVKRHADDVTLARLLKLEKDVRICRDALTKIYWETEDRNISNIVARTLEETSDG